MNFKSEVNSYEDICKILNIDPNLKPDVSAYDEEDKDAAISMFVLWNANKAAWNGEVIDFNKFDQEKYEVICYLHNDADYGLGFAYWVCSYAGYSTHASARLLWPSSTIGKHLTKVMREDFINVMKIPEKKIRKAKDKALQKDVRGNEETKYLTIWPSKMNFKSEINSYEDICKILSIDPNLKPDVSVYDEEDKEAAISIFRLWKANKVAWGDEVIDFNNDEQEKYEIRFYLEDYDVSDWGSEFYRCDNVYDSSVVGARLLWPSSTIGEHVFNVMREDFINVMKITKK